MALETLRATAGRAVRAITGPDDGPLAEQDPAGFGEAVVAALRAAGTEPRQLLGAYARCAVDLARVPGAALAVWAGRPGDPPVPVDPKDKRFADPTWSQNPAYFAVRQTYLALSRLARQVVATGEVDATTRLKARTAVDLALDAAAPTNFLATNPVALKRAFETGGASVVRGARNLVDDVIDNGGRPRQVDTSTLRVGRELAVTPAKVVYRNDLMELLQYEPQTEQVYSVPVLCSPPWINKYYVMDLAPGRSFIEHAVTNGRTVFVISYRNPSKDMSSVSMDDYLIKGPRQALEVVQEITGADTIDIVGLCLGGALTAATAAFLLDAGDSRIGNLTLLNTLLDYSEPGALGAFTDERTIRRLEKRMEREGGLDGTKMAGTFDSLRANDLIFNYVGTNWLMGEDPPAFDILAWNSDSTRLPATMHSFYLRHLYLENELAKGTLELAGRRIDLGQVKRETYVVSAENDHIVPWTSSYAGTRLFSGPVHFVLSSGGHIAGIVNPPGPKGWYLVAGEHPETPERWREVARREKGSWWEDWVRWSATRSGDLVDPPRVGSDRHPVLGDGPGRYVLGA